ncbi:MAG TPA: sensor histidine kinase [Pyrinomonadaceae bacterium]|nr:sensor histidine kinase [Pyrinomonadaceae bacterium]
MSPRIGLSSFFRSAFFLIALAPLFTWTTDTFSQLSNSLPAIEFTQIPMADRGGQETLSTISGRVIGGGGDQRIIIYARSGSWFVQPFTDQPFTRIAPNGSWSNTTHLGTEYAALLVEGEFHPPDRTNSLPGVGNGIVAVAIVPGSPLFWQTWWFWVSVFLATLGGIFVYYRIRQQRLVAKMNMKFEERLADRTRIAQDLHDTLLQGLLSASMQLHVADELLEPSSAAKPLVGRVLQMMGQVVEEGRNAVQGLRSTSDTRDLERALLQVRQECTGENEPDFKVVVEGSLRPLHPLIRDEVYRIGREALVNAFRHSNANRIEVELEYGAREFRLLIRDDGIGIAAEVMDQGRAGHWGLSGMRERTTEIGGKLKVLSRTGAGTEVALSIPADIAFERVENKSGIKQLLRLDRLRLENGKDKKK